MTKAIKDEGLSEELDFITLEQSSSFARWNSYTDEEKARIRARYEQLEKEESDGQNRAG